ncbi:MAG: fumarylacetoacetate hydrolase family protein [Thermoplasmatota archaeon]
MKVLCVGKNYAKHARELGGETPSSPIWFWKPESSIIGDGDAVVLPQGIGDVHHEVELAVRIGSRIRRAGAQEALRCVDAMTVAVDVTARDLQAEAKRLGRPWTQAKGYDTFLPLGSWLEGRGDELDLAGQHLRLTVDGEVRQEAPTSEMTWDVAALLATASTWTTLEPGDVLLTGTPAGVGPLAAGQTMVAELVGHARLTNPVEA